VAAGSIGDKNRLSVAASQEEKEGYYRYGMESDATVNP
jgi:hypothetical protein